MRLAFVIRLGQETQPAKGWFEGWVEEVDSCIQRRFRSAEELLDFLGQRFDAAILCKRENASVRRGLPEKKLARRKRKPS